MSNFCKGLIAFCKGIIGGMFVSSLFVIMFISMLFLFQVKFENELNRLDETFYNEILKNNPNNNIKKDIIILKKNNDKNELVIDIQKIIQIESNGNDKALNKKSGARGLCQIMRLTWNDCCNRLNYNWSFDEAYDPIKNIIIGEYYINKCIPEMLEYYNIPDNINNRLIAYNWGIGNLNKSYKSYKLLNNEIPKETKNYIKKYKKNKK